MATSMVAALQCSVPACGPSSGGESVTQSRPKSRDLELASLRWLAPRIAMCGDHRTSGQGIGLRQRKAGSVTVFASSNEASKTEEELVKEATEDLQKQLDSRRGLEERYLVINSGKNECRSCGFVYNSEKGDPNYPIPGGVLFSDLPSDWRCPTCGAAQSYFQSKGVEVAGFIQNQSYGLGGNSLTESQKSLLIYGSLIFFFALFLAGYLLQ